MNRFVLLLVLACSIFLLVGCGVEGVTDATPNAPPKPTEPFTPIVIQGTPTGQVAPPTPTPRPSATAAPTNQCAAAHPARRHRRADRASRRRA
jgi:hypothetical protein